MQRLSPHCHSKANRLLVPLEERKTIHEKWLESASVLNWTELFKYIVSRVTSSTCCVASRQMSLSGCFVSPFRVSPISRLKGHEQVKDPPHVCVKCDCCSRTVR